jgi:hypothetical protein
MTPTREQVQAWEDEAHNFADCHPDAEATDDAWSVIFYNRFAELAYASARAQALEDAAGACDEPGIYTKHDMQQAIRALKGKQ